ncbi:uncharacterized protein LOC106657732 [Trichogramma pretiosum]|uniref:uncharacterized protein LOC106657732 n=1 Tax=Trichogramma pretiosum TaxID=7493 RepID=UPI000C718D98|nr:uncharacterized protein LOC106657732 [Trichogramma pretiosum]
MAFSEMYNDDMGLLGGLFDEPNDNYVSYDNPMLSLGFESTAYIDQLPDLGLPTFASNPNSFEANLNNTSPIDSEPNLPPANSISPQSTSNHSDHSDKGPTLTSSWFDNEVPVPLPGILSDTTLDLDFMNYLAGDTTPENAFAQSFMDSFSVEESPYSLLENPARIPADQPSSPAPQKVSQKVAPKVAQKVAQKVEPEVGKKRGPGRPRKNKVASQETRKTTKESRVTSRKRQQSNNFQSQVEFGYPKLRELTLYKELGSAGTTPTPSSESSNSPPSNDIEDFVPAPIPSVRIYAPVVRKRRSTSDASDKLPQPKRQRKQVETTQPPVDHLYSANTITAQHPKRKTNARTTGKKLKLRLPTKKAPKEPASICQKELLSVAPLIEENEKVIIRPGYSCDDQVENAERRKGRKRNFKKPPIQEKYNKAANNSRRERIIMALQQLLTRNKIIHRRMARFSFLPGVTTQDVKNTWNEWVKIQNNREEYLENIRCQTVTSSSNNENINEARLEEILANNGVMREEKPKFPDPLKLVNESKIIHEVKQRFSANQGFILFFIEKFKISSPLLSGYVLHNIHPDNISDKVKEIILKGQIAKPPLPVKRECKPNDEEEVDSLKYRESHRNRLRHNAMERKRRLEQKMGFEIVKLMCPERYKQKSSIHDILRGLKNTLSMTSTYFYKKVVLTLGQKGYGNLELSKLKKLCKLTGTKERRESLSSK